MPYNSVNRNKKQGGVPNDGAGKDTGAYAAEKAGARPGISKENRGMGEHQICAGRTIKTVRVNYKTDKAAEKILHRNGRRKNV